MEVRLVMGIPREVRELVQLKEKFHLSEVQKAILVGTILGDGCLKKKGNLYRLYIKHSLQQRRLTEWMHSVFRGITRMPIHDFSQRLGPKNYPCAEFATLTHPEFTFYHDLFYREDGRKIVPREIDGLLNCPISIAVWIMDDGSRENAGVALNTHGFSSDEVKHLQSCLIKNFDLYSTIRKNKGRWIIYFPFKSLSRLREMISPYLLKGFEYKLQPYREIRTP